MRVGLAVPVSCRPAIATPPANGDETDRRSCRSDRCCRVTTRERRWFEALDELGPPWSRRYVYSPLLHGGAHSQRKPAVVDFRATYHSVGAAVRWSVRRIVWATEAIVVNAADEMTPSNAKVPLVDMRHATSAKASDVVSAETSDATDAQATCVASAKGTHTAATVASAKATHTAPTAPATPGLCARGKKAAGKHCACQNHHHSHDILHLIGRTVPPQDLVRYWRVQESGRQRRDTMEMRTLSFFLNSIFRSRCA